MIESLDFIGVSFTFDSLCAPIIHNLTARFPRGFTGIVGANGVGKSTLMALATGALKPLSGQIHRPASALYCPQRTDHPPEHLHALLNADDAHTGALRARLGLQGDWPDRWPTLSHGERKRAQIAVALWLRPDVLAIDEPSNHIDAATRDLLLRELKIFQGIGLLVSHDRTLLDTLCRQCLFLEPGGAIMRPGGYTLGHQQEQADNQRARTEREQAKASLKKLQHEWVQRQQVSAREHKIRSKRHLDPKDSDGRGRINRARVTDSKAGAPQRQLQGRLDQSESRFASMHVKKEARLSLWLPDSRARMDALLRLPPGSLPLGFAPSTRMLAHPELTLTPSARVAITGPNGAGKSTLIRHIVANLLLAPAKALYIPQELDAQASRNALHQAKNLPQQQLTQLLAGISQLGSDPKRLLQSAQPSPGETRKLLIALGAASAVNLIIMDEPTNHLDLPSIQCLESALADCPAALLLVSHDNAFLAKVTDTQWVINSQPKSHDSTLKVIHTGILINSPSPARKDAPP